MVLLSVYALKSAARLLAIAALLACLGVPRAAAWVAFGQFAATVNFRMSSHEDVSSRVAQLAIASHLGAVVALLLLSPHLPILCALACVAVYVSIYTTLARGTPPTTADLTGQVVVVTGSSAGIGFETARVLLGLGATVVFACRSEVRAQAAIREALAAVGAAAAAGRALFAPLDLSDCESVVQCAAAVLAIGGGCDALVCNAGCMHASRQADRQGWELTMGSNHLVRRGAPSSQSPGPQLPAAPSPRQGHHLLVQLLLPALRASAAGGRVVSVSSSTHKAPLLTRRAAGGAALAAALQARASPPPPPAAAVLRLPAPLACPLVRRPADPSLGPLTRASAS